MQIIIKVLKGQDCILNVSSSTTISEVKQEIEKILSIPLANQKLLLMGRTLNDDDSKLESYTNIKDGTKLNLIVMRPNNLQFMIHKSFRRFYNATQSERLTEAFMADFERKLKQLSLDDIERISDNLLCI